tara:strand:+ start:51 stop:524 length:474 start_codon:yes stop_codon:yes gene_type:complete
MSKFSHLPYRPCVGICLFNQFGQVFVGERLDSPGAWQMPQGGIDAGETIEHAAMRELKEETGTDKAEIIRISKESIKYQLPDDMIPKLWSGQYQGQAQYWAALKFTGNNRDINIQAYKHPEFSRWEWISLEETTERIVPFKRNVYTQVVELFKDIKP